MQRLELTKTYVFNYFYPESVFKIQHAVEYNENIQLSLFCSPVTYREKNAFSSKKYINIHGTMPIVILGYMRSLLAVYFQIYRVPYSVLTHSMYFGIYVIIKRWRIWWCSCLFTASKISVFFLFTHEKSFWNRIVLFCIYHFNHLV